MILIKEIIILAQLCVKHYYKHRLKTKFKKKKVHNPNESSAPQY